MSLWHSLPFFIHNCPNLCFPPSFMFYCLGMIYCIDPVRFEILSLSFSTFRLFFTKVENFYKVGLLIQGQFPFLQVTLFHAHFLISLPFVYSQCLIVKDLWNLASLCGILHQKANWSRCKYSTKGKANSPFVVGTCLLVVSAAQCRLPPCISESPRLVTFTKGLFIDS